MWLKERCEGTRKTDRGGKKDEKEILKGVEKEESGGSWLEEKKWTRVKVRER